MDYNGAIKRYYRAFRDRDRECLRLLLTPDFHFLSSFGEYRDRDAMLDDIWPAVGQSWATNLNMTKGWFLIWGPPISADFTRDKGDRWTLPLGGGVGRVFSLGRQKLSLSLEGYGNIAHPDGTPDSFTILTFSFIFPE